MNHTVLHKSLLTSLIIFLGKFLRSKMIKPKQSIIFMIHKHLSSTLLPNKPFPFIVTTYMKHSNSAGK